MNRRRIMIAIAVAIIVLGLLAGCGEKIAIPEAVGLFSVSAYLDYGEFLDAGARQLAVANNVLYVVGNDQSLTKRNLQYDEIERLDGLDDPVAVCTDEGDDIIFVWEAGAGRLSAWSSRDFAPLGAAELPDVQSANHLAACATGVDEASPGAITYVYIADPDSAVVHRYAWYEGGTAVPVGILCRDGGLSTRSVHQPAGMFVDNESKMYVCETDPMRNWVHRFDPAPDQTDVTPAPDDSDPWRGTVILIAAATCVPPVEADFVLGDAPECNEADWVGGASDVEGAFDAPVAVAGDGQGWLYVADSGNSRVQIFDENGAYELQFGNTELTPAPVSVGVIDHLINSTTTNYGAFVFVVSGDTGAVYKFISYDHYLAVHSEPPPDQP